MRRAPGSNPARSLLAAALAGGLLALLAACSSGGGTGSTPATGGGLTNRDIRPGATGPGGTAPAEAGPSWLFVQQAGGGTLARDGERWALTLRDVDPDVVGFTDRPARASSVESVRAFVSAWRDRFADGPPNAALVLRRGAAEADVVIVTLTDPVPESADGRTLRFGAEVIPVDRARSADVAGMGARSDAGVPETFGEVALFVDDADDRVDTTIYEAVVNNEEQYSIWPADRQLPPGWNKAGKTGLKPEVLAWIEEVWTDMRPKSLREKMQQAGLG